METARRASVSAWNGFVDCNSISLLLIRTTHAQRQIPKIAFFLTAHFSQEDYPVSGSTHSFTVASGAELALAYSPPHSMIGTFPSHPSFSGCVNLNGYVSMITGCYTGYLRYALVRAWCFSAIDLVICPATCMGTKQRV